MKNQQENEDSYDTSAGVDKDIKKTAGTLGNEILVNFVADGVKYAGDDGNVRLFDVKCEMNRSKKAKAECSVFAEMGEFSQKIVRDTAQIVYYYCKKFLADFF